jgi:hypothetical protein
MHQPQVLEDLPGNAALKGGAILFLAERMPNLQLIVVVAALMVQAALVIILTGIVRAAAKQQPAPDKVALPRCLQLRHVS